MRLVRTHLLLFIWLAALGLHAQSTSPTATTPIAAPALAPAGAPASVDLRNHFGLPGVTGTIVQFNTVVGRVNVELLATAAPRHVTNFLAYVQSNAYANSFFHRSAALDGSAVSIVQGGGYRSTGGTNVSEVPKLSPVPLEYNLPNARGTLAAARTSDLNSATSEWYFNTRDNSAILGPANGGGYTVFGRVIGNGMTVVDSIAALARTNAGSPFNELPVRNFSGGALTEANLILISSVTVASVYPEGAPAVISFSATSTNSAVVSVAVSGSTLTLTPGVAGTATVTVTATETNGAFATQTFTVAVGGPATATAPLITTQPQPELRFASGTVNTVVFAVTATGSPAPTYQWRRNNVAVTGQVRPTYVLTNASDAQAGTFTCVVTNSEGTIISQPSVLAFVPASPADTGRLVNLAIRTNAGTDAQTLIVGFSVGGAGTSGATPLLVRGVGPSLAQFGLGGVLADPVATMFQGSTAIATNDNWGGTATIAERAAQVGAFALASASSLDAALAVAPARGSYTVQITERNNRTGIALAEIYDAVAAGAFTPETPRLVNASARTEVGSGSDILIAGFVIGGNTARTVLLRAVGPTLAVFGVTDTLADPRLQLFSGATMVAENDNWGGDPGLTSVGDSVGAFRLASSTSSDAVILATLPPGSYTAQVSGSNGGTGVALVEVYEVP